MIEKLESLGARKPESWKAGNRSALLPAFCSELPAINWQFRAIASRLLSLPAFAIVLL